MKKLFILIGLFSITIACSNKKPEPVPTPIPLVKANGNLVTCPHCKKLMEIVKDPVVKEEKKPSLLDRILG